MKLTYGTNRFRSDRQRGREREREIERERHFDQVGKVPAIVGGMLIVS